MDVIKNKKNVRLLSNSTIFENTSFLFWGFDRASIKRTFLYKRFMKNNKELSFSRDNKVLVIKNELLTQTHKDVLEAIIILCDMSEDEHTLSLYSVLSILNKKSRNLFWVYSIFEDMNNVNFRFFVKNENGDNVSANGFKILDTFGYDDDYFSFTFSRSFLSLYSQSKVINYSEYTPLIANLNHDLSKQVVRYLLSYSHLQINLRKLLTVKLGLLNVVTKSTISKYISRLKEEDLSMFGIFFDGDNICINRNKEINFFNGSEVNTLKGMKKEIIEQSSLPFFDLD